MFPTITIDVGTTSVKLCHFDADGRLRATGRFTTPTVRDAHGEIYDLDTLRFGIVEFIRGLDASPRSSVRRVSLTGVGESGGLVRNDLSLASPMILWHDQRGGPYLGRLSEEQRSRLYRITGLPANGNYGLSKVAWAVAHAANLGDAQWMNVAEYLAATLSGERWSEPSLASRTMALDLSSGQWSAEAAQVFGLDLSVFPEIRPAAHGAPISTAFAADTGLDAQTLVHVAGHDHVVGASGAGLGPGELLNSTGTTEGLLFRTETPQLHERAERAQLANGVDCAGLGYTLFASIPTGGSAFATLQRMLGLDADRLGAIIDSLHAQYLSGSISLARIPLIVPQFRGSPPPPKRSAARGLIAGIGTDTSLEEIVFGTFLGMAMQFRDVLDLFGRSPSRVKVIGPASGNALWLQLKSDLLHAPLSVSSFPEVVSRGAQVLASDATGCWERNAPRNVDTDSRRHLVLSEWARSVEAKWEHLKGFPE